MTYIYRQSETYNHETVQKRTITVRFIQGKSPGGGSSGQEDFPWMKQTIVVSFFELFCNYMQYCAKALGFPHFASHMKADI